MKTIPLTKRLSTLVDDSDFDFLNQWRWCAQKTKHGFYVKRAEEKGGKHKTIYMHRMLCAGKKVDHKNHDSLDNQRHNLRPASHAENIHNSRIQRNNTSGFKGVAWDRSRNKWVAYIKVNMRHTTLGRFDTRKTAAEAYDYAAVNNFGRFACTNASLGLL